MTPALASPERTVQRTPSGTSSHIVRSTMTPPCSAATRRSRRSTSAVGTPRGTGTGWIVIVAAPAWVRP